LQANGFCHGGWILVATARKIVEVGQSDQRQKGAAKRPVFR
jgi:hypothetical protein